MSETSKKLAQQIINGILVHGFENDDGTEKVLRSQEPFIARLIAAALARAEANAGEPVAWLTEGYGYKRVFLDREAAEKLARGGDGNVVPLYAHPAPTAGGGDA